VVLVQVAVQQARQPRLIYQRLGRWQLGGDPFEEGRGHAPAAGIVVGTARAPRVE
jgi:hypothetical protein